MLKKVDYKDAREMLQVQRAVPKTETVGLCDAQGRIIAEDVTASLSIPPFDKSPFDGFAFRLSDVPGTLPLAGELPAGVSELPFLKENTACRIYTGAPVPPGADGVIKFEDCSCDGRQVTIGAFDPSNPNIIRKGENIAEGELLVPRGIMLGPAHLGVLASQGIASVLVYRRPKALIINTGTELSEPGQPRRPYGIYNSSFYAISSYLKRMGFCVEHGGTLRDDPELIASAVDAGLASDADIVMTTGGASVGDYDYALRAAEASGCSVLFWKVNMKPGGALLAAERDGKVYAGLSGNPAAAVMSILFVLQPYLRRLAGECAEQRFVQAVLEKDMPKTGSAARMLRGHALYRDGQLYFSEHEGRGNGDMASFINCDLIGIVPPGSPALKAGDIILALIPDPCLF